MATKQIVTYKTKFLFADFTTCTFNPLENIFRKHSRLEQGIDSGRICSSRGIHFAGSQH